MTATREVLDLLLRERILVLDGAMGTLVRQLGDKAADPGLVSTVHHQYLEAGSDIIETHTFNGPPYEPSLEAARLAVRAAADWTARTPHKPRFVAGVIGPVNRPAGDRQGAAGPVAPDDLRDAYVEQVRGLRDGGCDLLLVETICDLRQAQAALAAVAAVGNADGPSRRMPPVMLSVTVAEHGGRLPSGQTVQEFVASVEPARPFAVGVNCAFGARRMGEVLEQLARTATMWVSCHPSAGLPDRQGRHPETPEETASFMRAWAEQGLVNIAGGCCGPTPAHIRAVATVLAGMPPRPCPAGQRS